MFYTEEEIWNLTPRKFKSQLDVHEDIQKKMNGSNQNAKQQQSTGYIDQIQGW